VDEVRPDEVLVRELSRVHCEVERLRGRALRARLEALARERGVDRDVLAVHLPAERERRLPLGARLRRLVLALELAEDVERALGLPAVADELERLAPDVPVEHAKEEHAAARAVRGLRLRRRRRLEREQGDAGEGREPGRSSCHRAATPPGAWPVSAVYEATLVARNQIRSQRRFRRPTRSYRISRTYARRRWMPRPPSRHSASGTRGFGSGAVV